MTTVVEYDAHNTCDLGNIGETWTKLSARSPLEYQDQALRRERPNVHVGRPKRDCLLCCLIIRKDATSGILFPYTYHAYRASSDDRYDTEQHMTISMLKLQSEGMHLNRVNYADGCATYDDLHVEIVKRRYAPQSCELYGWMWRISRSVGESTIVNLSLIHI